MQYIKYNKYFDYNGSCGIHIHISIDNYTIQDHQILLFQYLQQKKYRQVLYLNDIKMVNNIYGNLQYCKKRYLYPLQHAIKNNTKHHYLDDTDIKSCLYKIHNTLNTIQWRGIRQIFSDYITIQQFIQLIQRYFNIMLHIVVKTQLKMHIK